KFCASTFCLAAICAVGAKCCSTQPPHTPKWGQRGSTRSGEATRISSARASSKWRCLRMSFARTRSPGNASATNTLFPSTCATPRPSWERSSIVVSKLASRGSLLIRASCQTCQAWLRSRLNMQEGAMPDRVLPCADPGWAHPCAGRDDGILSSLLLPVSGSVLVIPARARAADPLLGKRLAHPLRPFRMAVGDRDLPVQPGAIGVLGRHGLVGLRAPCQRNLRGVANGDVTIVGEPDCPQSQQALQGRTETIAHACFDRLDRWGLDIQVRL